MLYSAEVDEVTLTADEMIALSLFRDGVSLRAEEESFLSLRRDTALSVSLPLLCDGVKLCVTAEVSALTESGTVFVFDTLHDPDAMPELALRYIEAYVCIATYLARRTRRTLGQEITVILENAVQNKQKTRSRIYPTSEIKDCFERLSALLSPDALREMERVTHRLPTMKDVRFPFPKIRSGQKSFMNSVYRALLKREKLYVSAPTGTGKTMSVLFPAIRALGRGAVQKVFYLTPKTTTANAALNALRLLSDWKTLWGQKK